MVTFRTDTLADDDLDLGEILNDTCNRQTPTADLKDITITKSLPNAAVKSKGDGILLQSALANILDNAIKYSPEDSEIAASLSLDGEIRMSISDQGRGFGDTDLQSLTSRFSRGSNVTDIVGSGLGLTIADEVIRAHGGRLEIARNSKGKGACVSLILPLS